jgi:hypothetical protein
MREGQVLVQLKKTLIELLILRRAYQKWDCGKGESAADVNLRWPWREKRLRPLSWLCSPLPLGRTDDEKKCKPAGRGFSSLGGAEYMHGVSRVAPAENNDRALGSAHAKDHARSTYSNMVSWLFTRIRMHFILFIESERASELRGYFYRCHNWISHSVSQVALAACRKNERRWELDSATCAERDPSVLINFTRAQLQVDVCD